MLGVWPEIDGADEGRAAEGGTRGDEDDVEPEPGEEGIPSRADTALNIKSNISSNTLISRAVMDARWCLIADERCTRLWLGFGAWPFLRPEGEVAAVVVLLLSLRRVRSRWVGGETGSMSEKT
jgi:hypothetical protein